jgi:hypothetical protein
LIRSVSYFNTSSGQLLAAIFFLLLLHAAFFFYAVDKKNFYLPPDSYEYLNQRDNWLREGHFYQGNPEQPHRMYLETRRPPLMAFILATIKFICRQDVCIVIIQNLLSVGLLIYTMILLRKTDASFKVLLLPVFLLFFPSQMIYASRIMADVFFQVLIFVAFCFLLSGRNNLFAFFLFLTLATFVKPILFGVWFPALLILLLLRKKLSLKMRHFAGVITMASAVILFSWFNYQKTGIFAFSSAPESFLPDYVALPVLHLAEGREKAMEMHRQIHEKAQQQNDYPSYRSMLIGQSLSVTMNYPLTTIVLWIKGIIQFFIDPGRWDVLAFTGRQPEEHPEGWLHRLKWQGPVAAREHWFKQPPWLSVFSIAAMGINLMLLFGFLLMLKDARYPLLFRVMAAVVVIYLALMTGPLGSARYRLAIFPLLLLSLPAAWRWAIRNLRLKNCSEQV